MPADLLERLADVVRDARARGADAVDAVMVERRALSVASRLGKRESVEESQGRTVGLRTFVGKRQSIVASSDVSAGALKELVERAVAMAHVVPEDPLCGLADPSEIATDVPQIDACDPVESDAAALFERARAAEEAALAVTGISNSEGAEAGFGRDTYAIVASNGLMQAFIRSWHSLSLSVLAGTGTEMQRDYEYSSAVFLADVDNPEVLGRHCGERAVRRLGPRKVPTAQVPVVYEPRAARTLLGHLSAAINGASVARGTTFLADKLGQDILPHTLTVIDDPLRPRGLRSRPFDAEGIACRKRAIVERGVLTTWLLDLRSARQLQMASTGHAARGASSPPSPAATNFYLEAGSVTPRELIGDISRGFYVTELMGFGVNGVTGDYSRGAGGFWIEDGEITYPVSEVTVSGSLPAMFRSLSVASDLEFRYGTDSPTVRVDGMTIAGR